MRRTVLLVALALALSITGSASAVPPPRRVCQTIVVVPYVPMKVIDGGWARLGCHRARRIVRRALRTRGPGTGRLTCEYHAHGSGVAASCTRADRSPSYRSLVWAEPVPVRIGGKSRIRAIRRAVVIVFANGHRPPYFQVRVRFNRRLPASHGDAAANFLVGTSGSDAPPAPFGRGSRHCYASAVGNDYPAEPALRHARDGSRVVVTIRMREQRRIVQRVTARSPSHADVASLGCGHR